LIELIFLKEFNEVTQVNYQARIYSLKFLITFRLQIPSEWLKDTIKMLVNILNNSDYIIQSACLLTMEKILFMKDFNTNASLAKEAVNDQELFSDLIGSLMKIISSSRNIFGMRCFFRALFLTHESYFKPLIESLSLSLNDALKQAIANPSEDQYNYYLFETICMILRKLNNDDKQLRDHFSSVIRNNLTLILDNSITDLMGYVFQVFAMEMTQSGVDEKLNCKDPMLSNLLTSILTSEHNWTYSVKYLFQPFISFIKASFVSNRGFYANPQMVNQVFWVAQKLFEHKFFSSAFELIDVLLNAFPIDQQIIDNLKALLQATLFIHENLKQNNYRAYGEFSKVLLVFLAKFLIKTSDEAFIQMLESIQEGTTVRLLYELCDFLPQLDSHRNKKIANYALCVILNNHYNKFDLSILVQFGVKLNSYLEKFSKLSLTGYGGESIFDTPDLSYAANNYNKLINAECKFNFEDYEKIYQFDENELFFTFLKNVKTGLNYDLCEAINQELLKDPKKTLREREYLVKHATKYQI
jgi:hypothetical protein